MSSASAHTKVARSMAVNAGAVNRRPARSTGRRVYVAAAEIVASATRQSRWCGDLDRSDRCPRPKGRPGRGGPKDHSVRVSKAHGTHADLEAACDLWRRIDTGKYRNELSLPDEPRHRVGKARVVSPADQPPRHHESASQSLSEPSCQEDADARCSSCAASRICGQCLMSEAVVDERASRTNQLRAWILALRRAEERAEATSPKKLTRVQSRGCNTPQA